MDPTAPGYRLVFLTATRMFAGTKCLVGICLLGHLAGFSHRHDCQQLERKASIASISACM